MPGAGACEPLWCVWPILRRVAEHTRTSDVVENIFAGPIIKTQFVSLINSTANLCTRESTKCVNGPLPIAGVQTRQRDCSSNRRIPCHRPQICTVPQAWLRSFPPPCAGSWLALAVANGRDRKSTRLNSSHLVISYAVFCLKKKKKNNYIIFIF